jgi:hypothetical protein
MKTDTLMVGKNVNDVREGQFPLKIQRGGIEVKIYHRVEKQRYDCFTLAYYEKGLRHLKPFSSIEAAKDEAQEVLQRLILGEADLVIVHQDNVPTRNQLVTLWRFRKLSWLLNIGEVL